MGLWKIDSFRPPEATRTQGHQQECKPWEVNRETGLRLYEMPDAALGHDGDGHGVHDLLPKLLGQGGWRALENNFRSSEALGPC